MYLEELDCHQPPSPLHPPHTHHLMMMAIWNICFLKKGTEGSLKRNTENK